MGKTRLFPTAMIDRYYSTSSESLDFKDCPVWRVTYSTEPVPKCPYQDKFILKELRYKLSWL